MYAEMRMEFFPVRSKEHADGLVDKDINDCAIRGVKFKDRMWYPKQGEYHVTFELDIKEQASFALKFLKTDSYKIMI